MKRLIFFKLLLILLLAVTGKAQDGDFFLSHYSPGGGRIDNVNFDIAQDKQGVIWIANRSGIIAFDGKNWDFIKTPSAIFSLSVGEDNILYAGGRNGFGKIIRDINFNLTYVSLSDSLTEATDIFSTTIRGKKLYAINQQHLFIHNIADNTTAKIKPQYSGELSNLVTLENKVYITTANSGLQQIQDARLVSPESEVLRNIELRFVSKGPKHGAYLIGTENSGLYLFSDNKLKLLEVDNDQGYIAESDIQEGIWVSDTLAALSTLKGGVIFINPMNGRLQQIVNYQTGLPDNEIFALAVDRSAGVWVAHSMGLTRISPHFPFRSFSRYPSLEGKVLSVKNHQGRLYVGTTTGAYYLDEVRNYSDVISYIKVREKVIDQPSGEQKEEVEAEEKKKGGGLFSFLKRRRKKEDGSKDTQRKKEEEVSRTAYTYKKIVDQELQSIRYAYKKIHGINSKTFHFASVGSRLFCAGLDGLFEIENTEASAITRSSIRYFYISPHYEKIFASTYTDELKVFDYTTERINEKYVFGDYKDYVPYIFEDKDHKIWLCSINELYWVKLQGTEIVEMEEYKIDNPYYYETFGMSNNDSILFINESATYTINEAEKKFVRVPNGKKNIDRYLIGTNEQIWIHSDHQWSTLGQGTTSDHLNLLSLFKNISYISADPGKSKSYWVVTDNNDLYRLSTDGENAISTDYELYLKDIRTKSKIIAPNSILQFDQQNSELIFEFVQPEYSGILDIQYQYKLDGLNDTWSEWSPAHNIIDFPYLPEGEYTLLVKSKNALGKINQARPVKFEIIPPYWKRPWFYAFEFSALATLLFISIKMKKLGYRYQFMSRLLALLTLIIIIEFIQTIAENEFSTLSSPVLDFVIQVVIAIIILPFEGVLRKYFFKERNQILDLIKVKNKTLTRKK